MEPLENEIGAYKELLSLTEQEKNALIKNDVQSVSALVERQESALASIKKLGAERADALSLFCAEAGMPEDSRLPDVIETAGGALCEKLRNLAKELERTAAKLRRAGALNRMLIDTQLQYTSFCINLLTDGGNPMNTYSGSGRMSEGCTANHRLVDQEI